MMVRFFAFLVLIIVIVSQSQAEIRAKRAINPFLDSMGKRAVNPFLDSIGKRSLSFLNVPSQRYLESLGQARGKRGEEVFYPYY